MAQVELIIVVLLVLPLGLVAIALLLGRQWGCRNGRNPVDQHIGGEPGRLRMERNRHGWVVSVCVCFDVPGAFCFSLRREGLYDRLAKGLRVAREPQVSHEPFDAAFFLDAVDPLVPRLLEGTAGLRAKLAAGLARVEERGARLRAISCAEGRLHVHLATLGVSKSDAETSAHEAAMWVSPLLEAMRKVRAEPWETERVRRRAFEARIAPYIAFPLALTILVVVVFTAEGALWRARDLLPTAFLAGAAALLVYGAWAWRRTLPAQRHRRALEWLLLGGPAFTALAFLLLLALRTAKVLPAGPGEEGSLGPRANVLVAEGPQPGGGPAPGPSSAAKRVPAGSSIPNVAARNGTSSPRESVRSVTASPSRKV